MKTSCRVFILLFFGLGHFALQGQLIERSDCLLESDSFLYVDSVKYPKVLEKLKYFVNSIEQLFGLPINIYLIECQNTDNVTASFLNINGRKHRVLLYDPEWIEDFASKDEWVQKSVIAHEIGHHLAGHNILNSGSTPKIELEADYFTGVIVAKLGGSLENAIEAFRNTPIKASRTHPPRQERIDKVTEGWNSVSRVQNRGAIPEVKKYVHDKIESFTYKALVISNQNYISNIEKLMFPHQDAERLITILSTNYSFKENDILHLKDASRSDIINALDSLATTVDNNDNLLIFYAGHGVFDKKLNRGYWLPVDADAELKSNWVSNSEIKDYLSAFKSQHTLLISDACFSGSIFDFRKRELSKKNKKVTTKLLEKRSRKAMTSGLNKPVPDESKFIKYLLQELKKNKKSYLTAGQLFTDIQEAVLANTDNNPQFEVIKNADHEGGEFVFFKSENGEK